MGNKTKIKFGGGLNLVCFAASLFLTAKAVIELDKWLERKEEIRRVEKACETIDEIIEKLKDEPTVDEPEDGYVCEPEPSEEA